MRNSGFSWETLGLGKRLILLSGLLLIVLTMIFMFVPLKSGGGKNTEAYAPKTERENGINPDAGAGPNIQDLEKKNSGTGSDNGISASITQPEENKTQAIANELANNSLTQLLADAAAKRPLTDFKNSSNLNSYLNSLASAKLLSKIPRPASSEFTTSPDNSPASVKKYFNAVAQIYISDFSDIDSDVSILYRVSTSSGDVKAFEKLDNNIVAIEKAIREIKGTPTPYKWLGFAKDDVWYLSKTLAAVKIMRNTENDPAASLLILKDRMDLLDSFGNLYADTKMKLTAEGITFSPDEPASQAILQ